MSRVGFQVSTLNPEVIDNFYEVIGTNAENYTSIVIDFSINRGYFFSTSNGNFYNQNNAVDANGNIVSKMTFNRSTVALTQNTMSNFSSVAIDKPRIYYELNGNNAGILIESSHSYMSKYSQPNVAQLGSSTNVSNAATPDGEAGNWIGVTSAAANAYALQTGVTFTNGQSYYWQGEVWTSDGLAPVIGTNSGKSITPSLGGLDSSTLRNPLTGDIGAKVSGPYGDGKWLVQAYANNSTYSTSDYGWYRYSTANNSHTIKVGRTNVGPGRYPPSLFDNATSTPNTRSSDSLRVSLTGSNTSIQTITVFGEWTHRKHTDTDPGLAGVQIDSSNRFVVYGDSSNNLNAEIKQGGSTKGSVSVSLNTLTEGNVYRFAASLNTSGNLLKMKVTGLTEANTVTTSTTNFFPTHFDIGNRGNASFWNGTISLIGFEKSSWSSLDISGFTG